MTLKEWLFKHQVSVSDLARKINYSRPHVSNVVNGCLRPGRKLRLLLLKATDNQVEIPS